MNIKEVIQFKTSLDNEFYRKVRTLKDSEKQELLNYYKHDRITVINIICCFENDQLKIDSIRKFQISDPIELQFIISSLDGDYKLNAVREFILKENIGEQNSGVKGK